MRLLRVEVEHFAAIRSAKVELGRGLNVLYGPNDIGKSTLARAIRAALLIQHSSNAANEFLAWESAESPSVRVTFETADKRIWRVDKRFGTPGASLLSESKDGVLFDPYKRAREVDDELRTMLRWGIASPATKGAPRGLPTSFLARVLLGEQTDVAGVLAQTLEADTDESGRARLTAALEAFAQDPLFKSLLEEAQRKVDEAFTSTGKPKRGKTSPFREVTEEVKRVKEYLEGVRRRVEESENVQRRLHDCRAEEDRVRAELDDVIERRSELQRALAQLAARREVEKELAVAADHLKAVSAQLDELSAREAALVATADRLEEERRASTALVAKRDEARERHKGAEDVLRRARSDEAVRERQLRRGELDTRRLELEARATQLRGQRDAIVKGRAAEAQLDEVHGARERASDDRAVLDARAAEAEARSERAEREIEVLEVAARLAEQRRKQAAIEELERVRADVEADREAARGHRERADGLERERDARLPTATELEAMRELSHELELAEAKLGGGLSVAIERLRAITLEAIIDGDEASVAPEGAVALEGSRSITLRIGDVATVNVSAGERDAREEVERSRRRWAAEVAPALARAGAADLDALAERVERSAELDRAITEARALAVSMDARAAVREEQLGKLDALREEHAALGRELAGKPVEDAERALVALTISVDARRAQLRKEREAAGHAAEDALGALQTRDTELKVLDERVENARAKLADLGVERPAIGWDAEETRLVAAVEEIEREATEVAGALAALAAESAAEVESAEAALETADSTLAAVEEELEAAHARLDALKAQAARLSGEIEVRRASAAKLDLEGARASVAHAEARLVEMPDVKRDIGDAEIAAAERDVEHVRGAHQRALDEIRKAEGALQTVGGQVVREEEETAKDALRLTEQREREVELDYEAWRLLLEKLREAENTEGQHLGEALSQLVTERFGQLTAGRYGKLEVAANLKAEGVRASGSVREIGTLSVGTQEQLATLLRLAVAQQLGSTLVLDDHLTQTDPARSAWFRKVLREHAETAQIVVLTCRPLDYLRAEDLPASGEHTAIRAAGLLHAIDVSRMIEREGATGPALSDSPSGLAGRG